MVWFMCPKYGRLCLGSIEEGSLGIWVVFFSESTASFPFPSAFEAPLSSRFLQVLLEMINNPRGRLLRAKSR